MASHPSLRRPNRKEIDLFYKTHRSQFAAPERVHVVHIVKNVDETSTRDSAQAILEKAALELSEGKPFSETADRYSDCAGNGGELGWFARGEMVEEFEEVVFNLSPGETTPIFETPFGLHIARMLEKRAAGIRPLGEVYDEIADAICEARLKQVQAQ